MRNKRIIGQNKWYVISGGCMNTNSFPKFQEFLKKHNITFESSVSYYAYWVGRFYDFLENHRNISKNHRFDAFIKSLETRAKSSISFRLSQLRRM